MAVEQSGSEASPTPVKPAAAASQPDAARSDAALSEAAPPEAAPPDAKPDLDEVKRKFREALDRKRGEHAGANAEGSHDTGKVHGSHGPAASRRSFRRKSGSS